MNLVGPRDPETIARTLVLDAVALSTVLPRARTIVDLGSGAGLPGLPIAIMRRDIQLVSIEPRARRVYFQRTIVRELGLDHVTILQGRAEDLEPQPGEGVVAQAVARADRALDLMLPWVAPGGWLAIPAGPGTEIDRLASDPRIAAIEVSQYRVPPDGRAATIWCARRVA